MATSIYKGANRVSDEGLVGKTIDAIKADDIFVDALNLDGHEAIKVNGQSVQGSYAIRSGDAVEFYKAQGSKGNLPGEGGDDAADLEIEEEEGDDDEEEEGDDEPPSTDGAPG